MCKPLSLLLCLLSQWTEEFLCLESVHCFCGDGLCLSAQGESDSESDEDDDEKTAQDASSTASGDVSERDQEAAAVGLYVPPRIAAVPYGKLHVLKYLCCQVCACLPVADKYAMVDTTCSESSPLLLLAKPLANAPAAVYVCDDLRSCTSITYRAVACNRLQTKETSSSLTVIFFKLDYKQQTQPLALTSLDSSRSYWHSCLLLFLYCFCVSDEGEKKRRKQKSDDNEEHYSLSRSMLQELRGVLEIGVSGGDFINL